MHTKPTTTYDLTTASTLAIAAGTTSDYAGRAASDEVAKSLNKLSLRFAELALEALGGEPGKHDESAGV
ncbi:hypothetical protein [Pseudomonas asiatica]|uniref:hypothetical protein n=1 Tax=Pseudomonas asiatica TaxID=2219225 RepID=UPI003B95FD14